MRTIALLVVALLFSCKKEEVSHSASYFAYCSRCIVEVRVHNGNFSFPLDGTWQYEFPVETGESLWIRGTNVEQPDDSAAAYLSIDIDGGNTANVHLLDSAQTGTLTAVVP